MVDIKHLAPAVAWRFFVRRVRQHLHFLVCQHSGRKLQKRIRAYPALFCRTTCMTVAAWREASLAAVATARFKEDQDQVEKFTTG